MALFDKVKDQAKDLRGKVEEKVEDVQSKRRADDLVDQLGRLLYAERTARPSPDADAEIERIVSELKALEDGGVKVLGGAT